MRRRYLVASVTAALVVALDQATKLAVVDVFALWESRTVVPGLFNLTYVANKGAAFGFLNDPDGNWQIWLLSAVSMLAAALIMYLVRTASETERVYVFGLGLILGGALGNLIDRVRLGFVIDFLDFYLAGYHWPAFNVADAAICVGAGLVALTLLRKDSHASGTA